MKNFNRTLAKYRESLKATALAVEASEVTNFDEQDLELNTGDWHADDSGVWRYGALGNIEFACTHPIYPVERLKNIDTGELKVRLAFRRGDNGRRTWTTILTGFDTVANAKNIVSLSRIGISVTSGKRAQSLVDYLADVMDRNYDTIPERRSVSRVGWNEEGFSPYVDGIVFDGNDQFSRIFKAISERGDFETWKAEAIACRKYSVTARIVLAASFASVLIEPIGTQPFFVHLWGMDSGTGKTVAQMLAASVWADPAIGGDYVQTFRSTSVGFEIIAGFLNSLPVIVDELQLAKDAKGRVIFNVYELASGKGKLRSNKALGLAATPHWQNCFITSGETPLVSENDGSGAVNRVIEVECKTNAKVIRDGHHTANLLKTNYGHAGKMFIERLCRGENRATAHKLYEVYFEQCLKNDTTDKQAHAAALILSGDYMATQWIFQDGDPLTVGDIAEFMKSREEVSAADRGYQYMCDWVAQNSNKLRGETETGDVYGVIEGAWAYIIRSVFNRACSDAGISSQALLSHMKSRGLIQTRGKAMTKPKRIGKTVPECVVMRMPKEEPFSEIEENDPDLPEEWKKGGT